jgi:hypothetical protein
VSIKDDAPVRKVLIIKRRFFLKQFREDIKDNFIWELNITPSDYDERRGASRIHQSSSMKPYKYDDADKIIINTAHKCLQKKRQLLRVFSIGYHCYTLQQMQTLLSDYAHKDVAGLLPKTTIQTYMNRVIDEITKMINNNDLLRQDIHNAIKKEYERRNNR